MFTQIRIYRKNFRWASCKNIGYIGQPVFSCIFLQQAQLPFLSVCCNTHYSLIGKEGHAICEKHAIII